MKISEILQQKEITLSFEVFPPKTSDKMESVRQATEQIAALQPDFMSVTYGAGGGTSEYTLDVATDLQSNLQVPMLAHLTCLSSTREHVQDVAKRYKEHGIENIMALRGDLPPGGAPAHDFHYAIELINELKQLGDFCIGGACYPEMHPDSPNRREDILHLKEKVEAGCDFLTTQMFYDNSIFYHFLYQIREAGIHVPVLAGIMPVTNPAQIKRILSISGTQLPERFLAIVDRFGGNPTVMEQAGIIYATEQILDLIAHGIGHIHVYSMNKPRIAAGIKANLSEILKPEMTDDSHITKRMISR